MFDLEGAEGFIIDCDGTLLDSLSTWRRAEAPLFEAAGPMSASEEDAIHAVPIEEAAAVFHERYGVGESSDALAEHLESILMPFYREEVEALPGAVAFVRGIHEAGKPAVVLSSSPRRYLIAGLSRVGILDCFTVLLTPEESGIPKTDPAIYERALEILGTDPRRTWGVEDSIYAIRVMSALGIPTIGVTNGSAGARSEALEEGSTVCVSSLSELLV